MDSDIKEMLLNHRVINLTTGCWNWTGRLNQAGYGVWTKDKKNWLVHRASAKLFLDLDKSPKLCVLHKCDNPKCFNPQHLFLGTRRDNVKDMDSKGRRRPPIGERAPSCKLTTQQVLEIRSHIPYRHGLYTALSKEYGVSKIQIRNIIKRRKWKHV